MLSQPPQSIAEPVAPGESVMVIDGQAVRLEPVVEPGRIVLAGDGFSLAIAPTDANGTGVRIGSDGVIEVPASGGLQTQADGYCRSCDVDVYWLWDNVQAPRTIRSSTTAYPVTSVRTSESGTFTGVLALPASLRHGPGILQIIGSDPDDMPRTLNLGMRIAPAPSIADPEPSVRITAKRGRAGSAHVITVRGLASGAETREAVVQVTLNTGVRSRQVERRAALRADGSFTVRVQSRAVVRIVAFVDGVASGAVRVPALRD